jgi:NAD(P)-dependent dehydrogenase (short-subunit alcohol dehydrogenase family)
VLNKTALVTGSTAGIGLTIATTLAKEGAAVIINGRTQQRVDEALRTSDAAYRIAADLAYGIRILILAFAGIELNLAPRPLFHGRFLRPQHRTQQYCDWHGHPERIYQHGLARLAHIRRHHPSVV